MPRRRTVLLLFALLALAAAAWLWLRPYEWGGKTPEQLSIEHARLTRDHSYFWLDLRLAPGSVQELPSPLEILDSQGQAIKPAQVDLEGRGSPPDAARPLAELDAIQLRFWLEQDQLQGPLQLQVGEHRLQVRDGQTVPALDEGASITHRHHRW